MLWRIYKCTFDAAHHIKGHPTCGQTHGHTYHVTVKIGYRTDVWEDFHVIKDVVDRVISRFDHTDLGDKTCEDLAHEVLSFLRAELMKDEIKVELFETEHFGVEIDIQK